MTLQPSDTEAAGPGELPHAPPGSNADAEETARIEARLLAIGEVQVREMTSRKAFRKNGAPPAPSASRKAFAPVVLPRPVRWAAMAFAGWAVLGTVGALSPLGLRFIWFGAADYHSSMAWALAAVLLPAFAAFWFWTIRGAQAIQPDGMAWAGRWLGVFPGCVALTTAMVLLAPWGWSAIGGWALGTPTRVQVRVVSFRVPDYYRGCHLRAAFEFQGVTSPDACVDGRFKGDMPPVGSLVTVYGKLSRWGLVVSSIHGR
ncbi:hypothetical protein PMI14_03039 [Acidovorax sp. CF316]|uniref:hypothetical protein n=1 Tax=Acidovorax sp. CF316 TaxID=1144317 RepID=UPI00026BCB52|nr:hypothetical protein [Acidovorax sp. CF316]EJE52236.1 hypothetical protein PMI14_03039 [Acidovorax sp. CF316]